MRARRAKISISLPIVLGVITVLLSISLLVMWTLVILQNTALTRQVVQNTWILVIGIVSLVVIITVAVLMSVFLVREILEVRRQDSFIASVTHELKSPLASLKLCLDTLARSDLKPGDGQHLQQMMAGDVERLSLFIDDILEASRISARGGRAHDIRDVWLRSLTERCVAAIVARYGLDGSQIRIDIDADVRLRSDPTVLETVLKNLLDNAVKYSDPPPDVRVGYSLRDGKRACIEVSDRGIGIPSGQLKRIFDRFYRVSAEAVRSRRGTGLGLYVVAALVRSLGGKMEAHSEGVNRGTTMRVLLPVPKTGAATSSPTHRQ